MLEATAIVLSAAVVGLLLKSRLDAAIALQKATAKREAAARSRQLTRSIDGSKDQIARFLVALEQSTQEMRSQTDAAVENAERALRAAAEMSSRFDRGEKPTDNRPVYTLQDMTAKAEERNAAKFRQIQAENEEKRLAAIARQAAEDERIKREAEAVTAAAQQAGK